MGWACAVDLGWAPGTERAPGKRALVQRELCPEAAPLHNTAGLGALTAGGTGRGERERGLGSSWEWTGRMLRAD